MAAQARIDGFRSAMRSADLAVPASRVRHGDFRSAAASGTPRPCSKLDEPPTAIVAGSDLQALGVIRAAERRDSSPRDLSVVGYDDIPLAQLTTPPLTTIHQPVRAMAEEATRLVLKLRDGVPVEATRLDLATSLVVRESTAAPQR